jgi:hypothetical protein
VDFNPGCKIEVYTKGRKRWHKQQCTVVSVHPNFITVNYGNYKGSINLSDIKNGNIKIKVLEEIEMAKKIDLSTEELLKDCKEFGTDKEAIRLIAEKRGLNRYQVMNLIANRGIRQELAKLENQELAEQESEQKNASEDSKPIEGMIKDPDSGNWKPVDIVGLDPDVRAKNIAIDFSKLDEVKVNLNQGKPRLRPKTLLSQTLSFEYDLRDEHLVIIAGNFADMNIPWNDLDEFIKDLQEIKQIAEV